MAPLRDAVGLVDGKQRDLLVGDQLAETIGQNTLGRDVEKVELPRRKRAANLDELLARQRRIECCGADAELLHRLDLIAHQRDQRRNDDADAVAAERRDLEAQ